MKKIYLLIILYILGILFIIDVSDHILFPEQYFFNEYISDLAFSTILAIYFIVYLLVILAINMYLVKRNKNDNEDYVWFKWVNIAFLPLLLIALYEYSYSLVGIIDDPQFILTYLQRTGLIFLIVEVFLFSMRYFNINNEQDRRINGYIYTLLNICAVIILMYGLLFF